MSSRRVSKLQVRASVRQIDAHESDAARYLSFVILTIVVVGGFFALDVFETTASAAIAIAVVVMFNLGVFQPWHSALNVDMDIVSCRVEVRMFGVLPILRREYELADRLFAVERRHESKKVDQNPRLGCLMMALPFPLSLLGYLFGSFNKVEQQQSWFVLCLRDSTRGTVDDLFRIRDREVVEPLFEAVRDLLPGHVE